MIAVAAITGITVLASGLNPQSARIIIMATVLGGTWGLLSVLAYPLIVTIELFGSVLYVMLTVGFAVGSIQLIAGSGE